MGDTRRTDGWGIREVEGDARQAASLSINWSTSPFERGNGRTSLDNEGNSEEGCPGSVDDGEDELASA